jgi:hypothetical protein
MSWWELYGENLKFHSLQSHQALLLDMCKLKRLTDGYYDRFNQTNTRYNWYYGLPDGMMPRSACWTPWWPLLHMSPDERANLEFRKADLERQLERTKDESIYSLFKAFGFSPPNGDTVEKHRDRRKRMTEEIQTIDNILKTPQWRSVHWTMNEPKQLRSQGRFPYAADLSVGASGKVNP